MRKVFLNLEPEAAPRARCLVCEGEMAVLSAVGVSLSVCFCYDSNCARGGVLTALVGVWE